MKINQPVKYLKESGWIIFGQFLSLSGGFFLIRFLTDHLSPVKYGELALALTISSFINQVVVGGIAVSVERFYSIALKKNKLSEYVNASSALFVMALIAVVAIGLTISILLPIIGMDKSIPISLAALVFSVFSGLNSLLSSVQNAARERRIVVFHGILEAWLKILMSAVFMYWLGFNATEALIGFIAALLIVLVSQFKFLKDIVELRVSLYARGKEFKQEMWAYAWPFSIWGVFTWFQLASDRWALQIFASQEAVGQYAVLYQIGYTPISLVVGMATTLLGPIFYQMSGSGNESLRNSRVVKVGWYIAYISFAFLLIAFILAHEKYKWVFSILVSNRFQEIAFLLPWMLAAGGLFGIGQIFSLLILSRLKSKELLPVKVITALLGVVLNIAGAYQYGVVGVVGAQVIFSICFLVLTISVLRKIEATSS